MRLTFAASKRLTLLVMSLGRAKTSGIIDFADFTCQLVATPRFSGANVP
jgi:hypothetical protein